MKYITQICLALGLLLLLALLLWQGIIDVLGLLASSGWHLLWIPLIWVPHFLPATQAWRLLFKENDKPSFYHSLLAMWMGRAINNLLPVATIGGEIVKARLVSIWGSKPTNAVASVMVDKVVQALSVACWGLIGVGFLLLLTTRNQLALYALGGFTLLALGATGFLYVQKAGVLSLLARVGKKLIKADFWEGISFNAKEADSRIVEIYHGKRTILTAVCLRTFALFLQTGEVWLACQLIGHPIGFAEAVLLKSLTTTLSDIAFIIPNAYGIQEGAFILVGAIVGLAPDEALAVSLAIRIRDLIFDPAGLLTFHQIEARQSVKRALAKKQA